MAKRITKAEKLRAIYRGNPDADPKAVSAKLKVAVTSAYRARREVQAEQNDSEDTEPTEAPGLDVRGLKRDVGKLREIGQDRARQILDLLDAIG